MRLLALAVSATLALSGCTLIGAGAGAAGTAVYNNGASEMDHASVGNAALIGAAVGLLVDILVIKAVQDSLSHWNDK